MEYRLLGRSGLKVSAMGLGTLTFGSEGADSIISGVDVAGAQLLFDQAFDAGVNLFDTSNVYGHGRSEEILGEVVGKRRADVVIATKVRNSVGPGPNDSGLSRSHIIAQCEASLRRLGTDYIDIYQTHERDGVTPTEETLGAFDMLVRQGKVRYIGCSNYTAWQVMESLGVSDRLGLVRYTSQQIYYSLLHREAEYELVPMGVDKGVGILVWGPLAGGWLSGKYRRDVDAPAGSRHAANIPEPPIYDQDKLYDTIDVLVDVAAGVGRSPAQVALSYLMGKPGVSSVIIGARRQDQLADNLGAMDLVLDHESRRRLDEVSALALIYPHWHQDWMSKGRRSKGDETLLGSDTGPATPAVAQPA